MAILKAGTFRRAFIETAVITVGVFFALAADNWNDSLKDRRLEKDFLDGIALDLQLNLERIQELKIVASDLKASLDRVIRAVETGESSWDTPEEFVRDLVHCTYLGTPTLSSVAYDELQSTGSMRLIRDREFKRKLANYYADFQRSSQFHPEYRRKEAAIEEALIDFLPLRERLEMSEDGQVLVTNVDPVRWIQRLREQSGVISRLEDMVWVQHRILTRYDWVIDVGEELLADIGKLQP